MIDNKLPLMLYPTKVVLIDDDEGFISAISNGLSEAGIENITYTDATKAIKFINSLPNSNPFKELFAEGKENTDKTAEFEFSHLYMQAYNPQRHNVISIVVCDLEMPSIKGDEVLSLINNKFINKIMLTGKADLQLAIDLLNRRIIDNFAEKLPFQTVDSLIEKITTLQYNFFNKALEPYTNNAYSSESVANTDDFSQFLTRILSEHGIIEYYTVSQSGSKVMFTRDRRQLCLMVATESEMEGWLEIAEYANAPPSVTAPLKERSHLLFFLDGEDVDHDNWGDYFHKAEQTIIANQTVYYSVKELEIFDNKKIIV